MSALRHLCFSQPAILRHNTGLSLAPSQCFAAQTGVRQEIVKISRLSQFFPHIGFGKYPVTVVICLKIHKITI